MPKKESHNSSMESELKAFSLSNKISILEKCFTPNTAYLQWHITKRCNFSCSYCHDFNSNATESDFNIQKVLDSFNHNGIQWIINFTGGEPFLHKSFTELVAKLTINHKVIINTNLSVRIDDFLSKVKHDNILGINASLHPIERDKIPDGWEVYIDNILKLQNKGFKIISSIVAYPELISSIEKYYEKLHDAGIREIETMYFRGIYNNKSYPESYTNMELEIIKKYMSGSVELDIDMKYNSFHKRPCLAGSRLFMMESDGTVYKCSTLRNQICNFFTEDLIIKKERNKCEAKQCHCTVEGMMASSAKKSFFNFS